MVPSVSFAKIVWVIRIYYVRVKIGIDILVDLDPCVESLIELIQHDIYKLSVQRTSTF